MQETIFSKFSIVLILIKLILITPAVTAIFHV